MSRRRRVTTVVLCAVLAAATFAPQSGAHPRGKATGAESGAVVVAWNHIAQTTVFPTTPIPVGQVHMGLVSLAVYDAVARAVGGNGHGHKKRVSASAAAATAAHDVLARHFPAAAGTLAGHLATTLAGLPAGTARDRGTAIGHDVAADLLADRTGDGFLPSGVVAFTAAPSPGTWRPTADNPAPFLAPWLGFVRPLVLDSVDEVDPGSPDALTKRAYARDVAEVQRIGSVTAPATARSAAETTTARFFNFSVPVQWNTALRSMAGTMSAPDAARLLGLANVSAADAMIACWREKFDEPYWRPITAIREADTDGNRRTVPDPTWTPLGTPTPPYPEWPSGHACLTSAYTSTLEELTGDDDVPVTLTSVVLGAPMTRSYADLDDIRHEAFMARIWLGYHFRAGMEGGYAIGEETVDEVESRFPDLR